MKIFGYEINKAKPEPEVLDKDGNVVNKPSASEKIVGVLKTIAKVGVATGVAFGAYKLGGNRKEKEMNDEINKVNQDRLKLWAENADLEDKLREATSTTESESEETTDEDDDEEVVTF